MSGVEQAIKTLALPQEPEIGPGSQGGSNPLERMHGHTVPMCSFDSANDRPRNARTGSQLVLCPPTAQAKRTQTEPKADDIHVTRIAPSDARRLNPLATVRQ